MCENPPEPSYFDLLGVGAREDSYTDLIGHAFNSCEAIRRGVVQHVLGRTGANWAAYTRRRVGEFGVPDLIFVNLDTLEGAIMEVKVFASEGPDQTPRYAGITEDHIVAALQIPPSATTDRGPRRGPQLLYVTLDGATPASDHFRAHSLADLARCIASSSVPGETPEQVRTLSGDMASRCEQARAELANITRSTALSGILDAKNSHTPRPALPTNALIGRVQSIGRLLQVATPDAFGSVGSLERDTRGGWNIFVQADPDKRGPARWAPIVANHGGSSIQLRVTCKLMASVGETPRLHLHVMAFPMARTSSDDPYRWYTSSALRNSFGDDMTNAFVQARNRFHHVVGATVPSHDWRAGRRGAWRNQAARAEYQRASLGTVGDFSDWVAEHVRLLVGPLESAMDAALRP